MFHKLCAINDTNIFYVAEAINNPFGDDEDDFQICHLLSRHIWVIFLSCIYLWKVLYIGNNIKQFPGPPEASTDDDSSEEEAGINLEHVTVNVETNKNSKEETKAWNINDKFKLK